MYGPSFDKAKAQIKDALGLPQRIQKLNAPPPPPDQQGPRPQINPMTYQLPAGAPGAQQQPMASRFGGVQAGMQGQGGGANANFGPSGQFQGGGANVSMPVGGGQLNMGADLGNAMQLQNLQARYDQGPFSASANYAPGQGVGGGVQYQNGPFSASGGYDPNRGAYGSVGIQKSFQEGGLATSLPKETRDENVEFINTRNQHMRDMVGLPRAKGGGVWTRKEGQNPEGGLNAKGRASLKAQGQDIKPPVSAKQAKKSPKAAARRKSFCARMGGMEGPMKDDNGKPTRKALALRKWDC